MFYNKNRAYKNCTKTWIICCSFLLFGILWKFLCILNNLLRNSNPLGLSKSTHVDENALSPGLVDEIYNLNKDSKSSLIQLNKLCENNFNSKCFNTLNLYLKELNFQVFSQNYEASFNKPKPMMVGKNLYAIYRPNNVPSYDAILISTSFNSNMDPTPNSSIISISTVLSLLTALIHNVNITPWLAKDIIFLISTHKSLGPLIFTHSYFNSYNDNELKNAYFNLTYDALQYRSGHIQAAFHFDINGRFNVQDVTHLYFKHLQFIVNGLNGKLPNQDILNVAQSLANKQEIATKFRTDTKTYEWCRKFRIYGQQFLPQYLWQHIKMYEFCIPLFNLMSFMMESIFPYKIDMDHINQDSLENSASLLANSISPHAFFTAYGIDAISIVADIDSVDPSQKSPSRSSTNKLYYDRAENRYVKSFGVKPICRFLEGMIRSFNNVHEKLHASYFFYLLLSYDTFVPISIYMIGLVFLLFPLLIQSLILWKRLVDISVSKNFIKANEKISDSPNLTSKSIDSILKTLVIQSLLRYIMAYCTGYAAYKMIFFIVWNPHHSINRFVSHQINNMSFLFTEYISQTLSPSWYKEIISPANIELIHSLASLYLPLWICVGLIVFLFNYISERYISHFITLALESNDEQTTFVHNASQLLFKMIVRLMANLSIVLGLFAISLINFSFAYITSVFIALDVIVFNASKFNLTTKDWSTLQQNLQNFNEYGGENGIVENKSSKKKFRFIPRTLYLCLSCPFTVWISLLALNYYAFFIENNNFTNFSKNIFSWNLLRQICMIESLYGILTFKILCLFLFPYWLFQTFL